MTLSSDRKSSRKPPPDLDHSRAGSSSSYQSSKSKMTSDDDRALALLDMAINLVDSALDILFNHLKTDDQLRKSSLLMPGGTVGKHFRHVIETYRAFLAPLHPRSTTLPLGKLVINYDAFLPSTRRPLARSLPACRDAMSSVRDDLVAWGNRCREGSTRSTGSSSNSSRRSTRSGSEKSREGVDSTPSTSGLAKEMSIPVELIAITPTKEVLSSSIGRELWFCSLHAIHHFSMLRTIAVHELGLDLPVEFGTAPSTLLYRGKGWQLPDERKIKVVKAKL
ncbi:hypothetical protein BD324DRAFT_618270 [Kockovaella imperatae]|uniref:DinB-like domain-containing protein n=1 Tax=Kockovaella imperatae TaxID=4999 RepID=A0A1Y1ULV4_9TREE|nr:hypothetical protein BD324DRAFT_618270 [Kockovaella imperatae]ORX39023.1 hypothetical protein BD324DRAFT_618270 [Kockovaella imperatae]